MPARLRLLEDLPVCCKHPLPLLTAAMGTHGRTRIGCDTHLARNHDGSLSLLLLGQCIVRFYEDHLVLRAPQPLVEGYAYQLEDRWRSVLALWGADIVPDGRDGAWIVLRGGVAERLVDGLRVPYVALVPKTLLFGGSVVDKVNNKEATR